jgi:hypothetical protein
MDQAVRLDIQERAIHVSMGQVTGYVSPYALQYIEEQTDNKIMGAELHLEASPLPRDREFGKGVYRIARVRLVFRDPIQDGREFGCIAEEAYGAMDMLEHDGSVVEFTIVNHTQIIARDFLMGWHPAELSSVSIHPSRCGTAFARLGAAFTDILRVAHYGHVTDGLDITPVNFELVRDAMGFGKIVIRFENSREFFAPLDSKLCDEALDEFDAERQRGPTMARVVGTREIRIRGVHVYPHLYIVM